MSRRTQIIILLLAIVIVGILLMLFFLSQRAPLVSTPEEVLPNTVTNNFVGGLPSSNVTPSQQIVTREPSTQSSLLTVAETFVERFGSFSSHSQFENIRDSKIFMTEQMKQNADSSIEQSSIDPSVEFYGVTTKVIKKQIISLNSQETQAQVLLNTQRSETRGNTAPFAYYQTILLGMEKDGNSWKIDSALWQ